MVYFSKLYPVQVFVTVVDVQELIRVVDGYAALSKVTPLDVSIKVSGNFKTQFGDVLELTASVVNHALPDCLIAVVDGYERAVIPFEPFAAILDRKG